MSFKSVRKQAATKDPSAGKDKDPSATNDKDEEDDEEDANDAGGKTDLKGRFSIRVLKGVTGSLRGSMYTYEGEFENCSKLDRLIKQSKYQVPEINTPAVEIRATTNLYGIELKYPFPSCKKAKDQDQ